MAKSVGFREARSNFSHMIDQVRFGGQVVIVERSGRPMVAIIPIDDCRRPVAEREARFQVLDEIRRRMPKLPVKEVERDVTEAIAAWRRTMEATDASWIS